MAKLYIISACSGAGKTSLIKALLEKLPQLKLSISYTTRSKRKTEIDTKDYFFVSRKEFLDLIEKKQFLEYAEVYNNFYGTSNPWIQKQLANSKDIIVEIDCLGAMIVKQKLPQAIMIFILAPSKEALVQRLNLRNQNNSIDLQVRLNKVSSELKYLQQFDHCLINDNFDATVNSLIDLITNGSTIDDIQQNNKIKRFIINKLTKEV